MLLELPPDCDSRIRRFAEYVDSKAPPGQLPGRQHIVPSEIPDLLPFLALYDVVRDANGHLRYRTRLAGTHVVELFGEDPTGKFMDEYVSNHSVEQVLKRYHRIVATKEPSYQEGAFRRAGREHIRYHRAAFPLARNGADVDMLVLIRVGVDTQGKPFVGERFKSPKAPPPGV